MTDPICIVGLDEPEYSQIIELVDVPVIAHDVLPLIMVRDGVLYVEARNSARMMPVSKVIYHGIFEDDLDFITGLAIWNGPCLPAARGMMDCRLKLPCVVRALDFTQFPVPSRGYAAAYARYSTEVERVAKWGNWHCGENKERFTDVWTGDNPSLIEPFLDGEAVRVVCIGDRAWQIKLEGDDWLKSIHHDSAVFMPVDADLREDTQRVAVGFGLEIVANDYMVTAEGKYLLEVNHIPNVTRFEEIWTVYRDYVVEWVKG